MLIAHLCVASMPPTFCFSPWIFQLSLCVLLAVVAVDAAPREKRQLGELHIVKEMVYCCMLIMVYYTTTCFVLEFFLLNKFTW